MKRSSFVLGLAFVLPLSVQAEMESLYCRQAQGLLAPSDVAVPRQYAPSRQMDILHVALDVTPDFKARSVAGEVTLRFKPIAKPLAELKLDAVDLSIEKVAASSEKIGGWYASAENIVVTFEPPIPADHEATVSIRYAATPRKGLYFRTPEMGYKAEDTHLWTQGEPNEARHWY